MWHYKINTIFSLKRIRGRMLDLFYRKRTFVYYNMIHGS